LKKFKHLFLWAMNAKLFMGLYFTALVILTGFVTLFTGTYQLEIIHLFQILLLSVIISLVQVGLLDDHVDFNKNLINLRSIAWLAFSTLMTYLTSKAFAWFPQTAHWGQWGPLLLSLFMLIGLTFMLLGLRWEQEADTLRLNRNLDHFKTKGGS